MSRVVLGTRGSRLALAQSESCAALLRGAGLAVEVRVIRTTSDHRPEESLAVIDQRDVFTRQLDEALLSGEIDLAVHSLKDIPTDLPEGIGIVAIPERHDPSDVLVSDERFAVDDLPESATVATSSLRRRAQLLHHRPDLNVVEVRGNVDTRIRKMREGEADALVLARAGLDRLGLGAPESGIPYTVIPREVLLPAVGQGALGIAVLAGHPLGGEVRAALNHSRSETRVLAERAMLSELEGGCRVPVGAYSELSGRRVRLSGVVVSTDGALIYQAETEGSEPEAVGSAVARELLDQGAEVVLSEVREARRL